MLGCKGAVNPAAPDPRWCIINASWPIPSPMPAAAPAFENEDVATYRDAMMKLDFAMRNRNQTGQPFFLGVGLRWVNDKASAIPCLIRV